MPETFSRRRSGASRVRQRLLVPLVALGVVVAASYLSLVIVTRIDGLFFPGQGLQVGGLGALPGVEGNAEGSDRRINILVMGLDRQPGAGDQPTRTDTMFILTVDPRCKAAGILSIPRDLWVEIPYPDGGYYEDRVNAAYEVGKTQGYPGGGPGLVRTVVEHNLGIRVDYHVIVDFEGFIQIIDSLGGIDVYVPEVVDDPYYFHTELSGENYHRLHFEVGEHQMDGRTALAYSRTRYNSSDLDRIQRQQRVIFSAIDKALDLNLVDVAKMVDLWGKYRDTIETDINDFQLPGLAALAVQIDPARISALSLGTATINYVTPQGASVLLADEEKVQQIVRALMGDKQLLEEEALIEVQNATGADGLAPRLVEYLTSLGFSASSMIATNAVDETARPETDVINFSGKDYTVERLASLLAVPPERIHDAEPDDAVLRTTDADILVILGQATGRLDRLFVGLADDYRACEPAPLR